jgi:hypothetical protein
MMQCEWCDATGRRCRRAASCVLAWSIERRVDDAVDVVVDCDDEREHQQDCVCDGIYARGTIITHSDDDGIEGSAGVYVEVDIDDKHARTRGQRRCVDEERRGRDAHVVVVSDYAKAKGRRVHECACVMSG